MPKPLPPVISEDEIGHAAYERIRAESVRHRDYEPTEPGRPQDQYWRKRQGEFVEVRDIDNWDVANGREFVQHQYNPLDVLKDD